MKQLSLVLVAVIAVAGCSAGTPVTITNQSAAPIENVVIFGSGFRKPVGSIAAGQSVSVRVQPKGESGLGISFRSGPRLVEGQPQGYFEGGGAYKVSVAVAPDLSTRVRAGLKY